METVLGHKPARTADSEIEDIKYEIHDLQSWEALKNFREAKFLLKYFEKKLQIIRGQYSSVDMTAEGARDEIARIQGKEEIALENVQKLKAPKSYKKSLDERLQNLLKRKEMEKAAPTGNHIVSHNVKGKSQ